MGNGQQTAAGRGLGIPCRACHLVVLVAILGTLSPTAPLRAYQEPQRVAEVLSTARQDSRVTCLAMSASGASIAWAETAGTLRVVDSGATMRRPVAPRKSARVRSVAYSPSGHVLALGAYGDDPHEGLPDEENGRALSRIILLDLQKKSESELESSDRFYAFNLAFSSDGRMLASQAAGGIAVWELGNKTKKCQLKTDGSIAESLCVSPDARLLAGGDGSRKLRLWDLSRGGCIYMAAAHRRGIASISFSPDGSKFATGSLDHRVKVWNTESRTQVAVLGDDGGLAAPGRVCAAGFLADGRTLVSAHSDNFARVWDVATGKLEREIAFPIPPGLTVIMMKISADAGVVAVVLKSEIREESNEAPYWVYMLRI
jgi:WD40 repeat protein